MKIITDDGQEFAIETVKTTDLSPEDVIVFRSKHILSNDDSRRVGDALRCAWPDNQTMILGEGSGIEIVSVKEVEIINPVGVYGSAHLTPEHDGGYVMTGEQAEALEKERKEQPDEKQ